jgi:hypothetical protein
LPVVASRDQSRVSPPDVTRSRLIIVTALTSEPSWWMPSGVGHWSPSPVFVTLMSTWSVTTCGDAALTPCCGVCASGRKRRWTSARATGTVDAA